MIALDENALICDLAETYGVYDYRSLPVHLAATFSCGLREDSRIRCRMRGEKLTYTESIGAMIYDLLANYIWAVYGNGGDKPESLLEDLNGIRVVEPPKNKGFDDSAAFEEARRRIIGGK